jgi:saccharopine dehydrogenase (NAD+, L-lysine-forming)
VDELIDAFRDYSADVYEDGQWRRVTGSQASDYRRVDFEFGFGRLKCVPMSFDEMRPLPEMISGLRSTGFYIAGWNAISDYVISPLIMLVLKLKPGADPKRLGKLLCWSTRVFGSPPYGTVLQLDAEGTQDGSPASLRLAMRHEHEYELTAIPLVAMIEQLLDGTARRPGLHRMGQLIEPNRALTDIEAMGVELTEDSGA